MDDEKNSVTHGALRLDTGASAIDLEDHLCRRLRQLNALSNAIYGDGFEPFHNLNDELQHDYLWAIHDNVTEVRMLFGELSKHLHQYRELQAKADPAHA